MADSEMRLPLWLKAELQQIMASFVDEDYDSLVVQTKGIRLPADEMRRAVSEYGRRLVLPPEKHYSSSTFGEIVVGEPSFWVDLPFYTEEEGRSDLEVRLTVYVRRGSNGRCIFEIDGILVP